MSKFPFTARPDDITALMNKIAEIEVPEEKIGAAYIKSLGFPTGSARRLLDVLKKLGFIDKKDDPSSSWMAYVSRGPERGKVMASAIRNAYPALFNSVFCPYLEGDETIMEILGKEEPKASSKEMSLIVESFRRLSELGDFQDLLCVDEAARETPVKGDEIVPSVKVNPNLQLNIQVHIDPNTPEEKIEAIFKNMRKYLMTEKTEFRDNRL